MIRLEELLSFEETCDDFDAGRWSYYGKAPIPSDGAWLFRIPANYKGLVQANYKKYTGYGTYTVRLKVDTVRVPGVTWFIFLYGNKGDYKPGQMELDFVEVYGKRPYPGEYSLSFWVDGKSGSMGIGYWYFNVLQGFGINFEDGDYHVFKYVYSADDLVIFIDGTQVFKWSMDCRNILPGSPGYLGIPKPPMQFMIGGKGDGSQAASFDMAVSHIKYQQVHEAGDP